MTRKPWDPFLPEGDALVAAASGVTTMVSTTLQEPIKCGSMGRKGLYYIIIYTYIHVIKTDLIVIYIYIYVCVQYRYVYIYIVKI